MAVPHSSPVAARGDERQQEKKKRTRDPGVRVVGSRIYDSSNGKTCHQCRQKTLDFTASCKKVKNGKLCTVKFCHKCLLNRYGEKAAEVEELQDWSCPKCREVCNCSCCMKKKGRQPTGILVHAAKKTGFSSVIEMLHNEIPKENAKEEPSAVVPTKKTKTLASKKLKVEMHLNLNEDLQVSKKEREGNGTSFKKGKSSERKHLRKHKIDTEQHSGSIRMKRLKATRNIEREELIDNKEKISASKMSGATKRKKQELSNPVFSDKDKDQESMERLKATSKIKREELIDNKEKNSASKASGATNVKKQKLSNPVFNDKDKSQESMERLKGTSKREREELIDNKEKMSAAQVSGATSEKKLKLSNLVFKDKDATQEGTLQSVISSPCNKIVVPDGEPLALVGGVDLPVDGVGPALQFLEFCRAFSKVLGIRKGQPEIILKEMASPRVVRQNRVSCSPVVQFHMKLLSIIQKDKGQESLTPSSQMKSWLQDLEKYAHGSEYVQEFPLAGNGTASVEYGSLELSEKLGILNFLCNEALGTDKLRRSIDEENMKFNEKKKEATENVLASKAKKKDLQQKLKDEIAKAMLSSREGAPISISDYDKLISSIKAEAEKAHVEIIKSQELLQKRNLRSDAVRTEPMLQDNGRVYWTLESSGISNVMCQDVGNIDLVKTKDRWFVFSDDQEQVLVKYITSKRFKSLKRCAAVLKHAAAES